MQYAISETLANYSTKDGLVLDNVYFTNSGNLGCAARS
jgi:hypothetical protein